MRRPSRLIREYPAPGDAVDRLLALHDRDAARYPVLLESAASGTPLGRFTLLLAAPGERLSLARDGALTGPGSGDGFCARLDDWWRAERGAAAPAPWPFTGGWYLYLGYELAGEIEPTLRLPASPWPLVALAWRMRAALVIDHERAVVAALAEPAAAGEFERMIADFERADTTRVESRLPAVEVTEDEPARYLAACRRALEHIAAGDVYQANLARSWRTRSVATPGEVYARLRRSNPGSFAGSARIDDRAVLSSSPERLVRVRGRLIDTRPIAGTRPRLPGTDAAAIADLTGSAKERAEHVMLIDLERNDLGRICEAGSVRVDEFMAVESYAHVHHIVSNVSGRLRPGVGPGGVVRALFPGGTITGCPKVRCMQLIGDLEGEGRGAYTGSMGYLAQDGSLDLNILIRTMTLAGGTIEWRAGAGIVADSVPELELEETRAKARGLLRALGGAG